MDKRKKRIFEIIQIGNKADTVSKLFDLFIVVTILVNIAVTFMMTFSLSNSVSERLRTVEFVTILIFSVEYVLRLWTAVYLYPEKKPVTAALRYSMSFYGLVDLLTILPYYMPFLFPSGAVAFRMFRVVRILHLFRINAQYDAFHVITRVLKEKKNQLVSSVFLIAILMLASSLCMYDLEHEAQPEHFTNAFSGIWWSVSTLLTVGYGDIYPVTAAGRVLAIVIAFLGVGVVAIPTGIISAGFVEYYTKIKTGAYMDRNADFISVMITGTHEYAGRRIGELALPGGLYVAALLRGEDILTPYPETMIGEGDHLLLGTEDGVSMDIDMEEVTLEENHPWIGKRIKDLDISRRTYVVMIKRKNRNISPQGSSRLLKGDTVLTIRRTVS